MSELRDLYEEVILDHNRSPRNYPKGPEGCNHSAAAHNPSCGDEVEIHLTVNDGLIVDVGFEGEGCAISTASASMLTEALKGKSEAQARSLFKDVHAMLTDTEDNAQEASLGKLAVLGGVKDYPMRVKCASLAWHTMIAALDNESSATTE